MIPELPGYLFEPTWMGLVSLLVAAILPLVAALVMKAEWAGWIKGLILLTIAAGKSYGEAFIASGGDFDWKLALVGVGVNFGIAVAAHFGLLKGSPLQTKAINTGVR